MKLLLVAGDTLRDGDMLFRGNSCGVHTTVFHEWDSRGTHITQTLLPGEYAYRELSAKGTLYYGGSGGCLAPGIGRK